MTSNEQSDAALVTAVREGDTTAYGTLYARHAGAARRLAHTLVPDPTDADDLVSETFAKVLAVLRAGRGPQTAFRAYLNTTLRHVRYDRIRRDQRLEFTDDITRYERGEPVPDPAVSQLERSYAARAFAKLPERWRNVLWHTEVEGGTPAQVAPLLGLTPGGVATLAHRARERLRQMYLQEHVSATGTPACHRTGGRLAGYLRDGLATRDRAAVEEHLAACAQCRSLLGELSEVNAGLRRGNTRNLTSTAAKLENVVPSRYVNSYRHGQPWPTPAGTLDPCPRPSPTTSNRRLPLRDTGLLASSGSASATWCVS